MEKICLKNIFAILVLFIVLFTYLQAMKHPGASAGSAAAGSDGSRSNDDSRTRDIVFHPAPGDGNDIVVHYPLGGDAEDNEADTQEDGDEEKKLPRAREKPSAVFSGVSDHRPQELSLRKTVLSNQLLKAAKKDFDEKTERVDIVHGITGGTFDEKHTSIKQLGAYHLFVLGAAYQITKGKKLPWIIKKLYNDKLLTAPHIDDRDRNGRTALHYACAWAQFELAQYLLEHDADFELLDNQGRGVMHYACGVHIIPENLFRECADIIDDKRCVSEHYSSGLKRMPDHLNEKNRIKLITELEKAFVTRYGSEAHTKICNAYCTKDSLGRTPLDYATASEYSVILEQYKKTTTAKKSDSGCKCVVL